MDWREGEAHGNESNQKFIEKSWHELSEHQAGTVSVGKEGTGKTPEDPLKSHPESLKTGNIKI